jgi:hypothetical protein
MKMKHTHTETLRELAAYVAQNPNNAQAIADALVVVADSLDAIDGCKGCQGCEDCGSGQKVDTGMKDSPIGFAVVQYPAEVVVDQDPTPAAAVAQDPTPVETVAQDPTPVESVAQDTIQVQGA